MTSPAQAAPFSAEKFIQMRSIFRFAAVVLLVTTGVSPFARFAFAQEPNNRTEKKTEGPSEGSSVAREAGEAAGTTTISNEPVMRIALSTGTGAATISTNAKL